MNNIHVSVAALNAISCLHLFLFQFRRFPFLGGERISSSRFQSRPTSNMCLNTFLSHFHAIERAARLFVWFLIGIASRLGPFSLSLGRSLAFLFKLRRLRLRRAGAEPAARTRCNQLKLGKSINKTHRFEVIIESSRALRSVLRKPRF